MKVVLLHGFNVWDGGRGSVGKLEPRLSHQHEVILFPYGRVINPLKVRSRNNLVARQLVKINPDAIIGHSNAAVIMYRAAQMGLQTKLLTFVQPALHYEAAFPDTAGRLVCLWNPNDWIVRMARMTNPIAIFQEGTWGAAGARGMKHAHQNYNTAEGPFPAKGHSTIWRKKPALDYWGEVIAYELGTT